jgi:hypothetical protein
MFCEIDNIMQNIPHIEIECEECSAYYCESHWKHWYEYE